MIWIDENPDLLDLEKFEQSLIKNCLKYNQNTSDTKINIICQNKTIGHKLAKTLDQLNFSHSNIGLRLGWFKDDTHNLTEVFEDETLFIGHDNYCRSFEKVFDNNTCKISKSARDNNLHIGFQRHFSNHANPRSISLGELTSKLNYVDPMLRNIDGIFFFLDAIRKQESYISESFVSGMNIEQACRIARFAGMSQSNKLMYFNIGEKALNPDSSETTALLIWYYLEGAANRHIESLEHKNNHTYMVNHPYFEEPIKFIRTNITGRWWFQHPDNQYFVPCTEEDYKTVSEGRIPDNFLLTEVF